MISSDLLLEFNALLATALGQISAVSRSVKASVDPEQELNQLKAAQALLSKSILLLLDDVYRKALAEKIAFADQNCPGNCGQEALIERLRTAFPEITLEEVPRKLKEAMVVETKLRKILTEKIWTPPLRSSELRGEL